MSVQATTAVWEHSEATGADLLAMLAIADAANAEGRNAYPGSDRLQKYCRKGARAVLASIERNIERGELRRVARGFRGSLAVFEIVLPGLAAFEEQDDEQDGQKGEGNDAQTGDHWVNETRRKGAANERKGRRKLARNKDERSNGVNRAGASAEGPSRGILDDQRDKCHHGTNIIPVLPFGGCPDCEAEGDREASA